MLRLSVSVVATDNILYVGKPAVQLPAETSTYTKHIDEVDNTYNKNNGLKEHDLSKHLRE